MNYDKWDKVAEAKIMRFQWTNLRKKECFAPLYAGSATILHATTRDRIMGTVLDIDNTDSMNSYKWLGLNELGLMFIEVGDKLQMMDTPSPKMITLEWCAATFLRCI